jgi:uncharacterized protein YgiM (DUF1202 family)
MKKLLPLILLLVSCSPLREQLPRPTVTPTPQATFTATAPSWYTHTNFCTVTASSLHLRTGAGISYPVRSYLKAGDVLTIHTRGNWHEVTTADGITGWINSNYCKE